MKSLNELKDTFPKQREDFKETQEAKFDTEFAASKLYFERTGRQWGNLSPTQKRKEIENYLEDNVYDRGGPGLPEGRE